MIKGIEHISNLVEIGYGTQFPVVPLKELVPKV
jgi:hypothetical protein